MSNPYVVTVSVGKGSDDPDPKEMQAAFPSRDAALDDARDIARTCMRVEWFKLGPMGGRMFRGYSDDGCVVSATVEILN
jgi:hypothetical protein